MTYEYECTKCGQVFEVEQAINDPPLTKCPLEDVNQTCCVPCGGEVKRLVSAPPFVLKGKGWAKDGYR